MNAPWHECIMQITFNGFIHKLPVASFVHAFTVVLIQKNIYI